MGGPLARLEEAVCRGDYDAVVRGYERLDEEQAELFELLAMDLLRHPPSQTARDMAALILGELEILDAKPVIVEYLQDPETKGTRGALVGALGDFELGAEEIGLLIELVTTDTFETRQVSLGVLKRVAADLVHAEWARVPKERVDTLLRVGKAFMQSGSRDKTLAVLFGLHRSALLPNPRPEPRGAGPDLGNDLGTDGWTRPTI